jgi:hypothetical protein
LSHSSYDKIPKPLEYRLGELVQSLQIIRDGLQLLERGYSHQILPIAGQLRALLLDKTTPPLLSSVAKALGKDLQVWTDGSIPGTRGPNPQPDILFGLGSIHLTAQREFAAQRQVTLEEALGAVVLHAAGTGFSARDIIEFLANKAGGAHYSEYLPRTLGEVISTIHVGGLPAPATAVLQFGKATLELGLKVLRELAELDVDFVIAIRRPPADAPTVLFDMCTPDASMRVRAELAPNLAFTFAVVGIGGSLPFSTQNAHGWERPHHVRLSHRITNDVMSHFAVLVDGEQRSSFISAAPLILASDSTLYDVSLGRDLNGVSSPAEWALGSFSLSAPASSSYAEAEDLLRYRSIAVSPGEFTCFAGGRLFKRHGQTEFEGELQRADWQQWLAAVAQP